MENKDNLKQISPNKCLFFMIDCPQLSLSNIISITIHNVTKYLGVHLDKRLTKAQHAKN